MSKQSSVEFLFEKLEYTTWMRKRDEISEGMAELWKQHYLDQAKAMHKQEIEDAFKHGKLPPLFVNLTAQDYYNQTFEQ